MASGGKCEWKIGLENIYMTHREIHSWHHINKIFKGKVLALVA